MVQQHLDGLRLDQSRRDELQRLQQQYELAKKSVRKHGGRAPPNHLRYVRNTVPKCGLGKSETRFGAGVGFGAGRFGAGAHGQSDFLEKMKNLGEPSGVLEAWLDRIARRTSTTSAQTQNRRYQHAFPCSHVIHTTTIFRFCGTRIKIQLS